MSAAVEATTNAKGRLPRQIAFIIGNEGCERFSFYGMRNILTALLVSTLLLDVPEAERFVAAKDVFHIFGMGVYFFPLLGGWLSDRCWGKYKTILWLSLVYCAGHAFLAIFEKSRAGFGVMAFRMFFFAAFAFAAAIAFGFCARRYKSVGHYRSS